MAANSTAFHEDPDALKPATKDRHRAIASLMEELEAVDWYDQRIDAAGDEELRQILAHNRDEEKEHAAMVLEWLRRHDPQLDAHLKGYVFSEGNLLEREEALEEGEAPAASDGSLGIGSLRAAAK
jgi:uncharacterized protein